MGANDALNTAIKGKRETDLLTSSNKTIYLMINIHIDS